MIDIWPVLAAFTLVTVAPGPANLAVSLAAMAHGVGQAMRMAAGLALGLAIWGIVAATGLGAVLAASEIGLTALRVLGAAYLVWLAWQTGRAAFADDAREMKSLKTADFSAGLWLNLTNPKAVLAWMAALSLGLNSADASLVSVLGVTAVCAGIGLLNYFGWALILSRGVFRRGYQKARRAIDGAVAMLFGVAGIEMLRQGIAR